MKLNIDAEHDPIALILQIHDGELTEAVLVCEFAFEGHTGRRDVWLKDLPDSARVAMQRLITKAIQLGLKS